MVIMVLQTGGIEFERKCIAQSKTLKKIFSH